MNIVIFGGGSQCRCILDILKYSDVYNIIGIIDSNAEIDSLIDGFKVIGRQNELVQLAREYCIDGGIIALGDNYNRYLLEKGILEQIPSFEFINVIHPSVVISRSAKIGNGNVFMAGVIINTGAVIENHCIINTGSQLEHFSIMEDYSSLSAGVITGGYVHLKRYAAVALGVTIFDRVKIGFNTVVGSGSLVIKDLPDNVLVYGTPAKVVRERELNDKFLK